MPNRIVREGILNSDRVNALDWPSEVFYRRLLNKVDDHGLFDARPAVLRTSLYPLKVDRVREADCSRWLAECEKAGLIVLYKVDEKPYLKVLDTRWNVRSEPKFPKPPSAMSHNCAQLQATAPVVEVVVVDEDEDEKNKARQRATPARPGSEYVPSKAVIEWAKAKGFAPYLDLHIEEFRDICRTQKRKPYADLDAAFRNCVRGDWGNVRRQAKDAERRGEPVLGLNIKKHWWQTTSGIEAKAKELHLTWDVPKETFKEFADRVMIAAGVQEQAGA